MLPHKLCLSVYYLNVRLSLVSLARQDSARVVLTLPYQCSPSSPRFIFFWCHVFPRTPDIANFRLQAFKKASTLYVFVRCYSVYAQDEIFFNQHASVRFFQTPPTLPTLIDFSVSGKTAVNNPRGKKFIGPFWSTFLINFLFLFTLPYTILLQTESLFSLILCSPRFSSPFSPPSQTSLDAQKPCGQQHRN